MRVSVKTIVRFVCSSIVLVALPAMAEPDAVVAQPDAQSSDDRWAPAMSILAGFNGLYTEGDVIATDNFGNLLRRPDDGGEFDFTPLVGVGGEVATPALPLPGRPRLYVSAEILPSFASRRDVASEGNPSGFQLPPQPDLPPGQLPVVGYNEGAILGQGSRASTELETLGFGAGVGLSFPVEAWGRQLHIRPSFEWTWFEMKYEGVVLRAQCLPYPNRTECISYENFGFMTQGATRLIDLSDSESHGYNAIGGGLQLAMDTGRTAGPLGVDLYLTVRGYYVLGDRKVDLSDSESFDDDLGVSTATADWSFKVAPWVYRAMIGMRFTWQGDRD